MDTVDVTFIAKIHEVVVTVAATTPAGRYRWNISYLIDPRLPEIYAENGFGLTVADGTEVAHRLPVSDAVRTEAVRAVEDVTARLEVLVETHHTGVNLWRRGRG